MAVSLCANYAAPVTTETSGIPQTSMDFHGLTGKVLENRKPLRRSGSRLDAVSAGYVRRGPPPSGKDHQERSPIRDLFLARAGTGRLSWENAAPCG